MQRRTERRIDRFAECHRRTDFDQGLQADVSHRPHSDLHNVPFRKYPSTIVCSIRIMCLLVSVYRNQIVVTELEVAVLIV